MTGDGEPILDNQAGVISRLLGIAMGARHEQHGNGRISAAFLVFLTFYMKTMVPLRLVEFAATAFSSHMDILAACIRS